MQLSEKPLKQKQFEHNQKMEEIKKINNQINNLDNDIINLEVSKKKMKNSIFNNKSTEIDCIEDKKSNNNLITSTMTLA